MSFIEMKASPDRIPNAKKWTEQRVTAELVKIKEVASEEGVVYIGTALDRVGLYGQLWSYWKETFAWHDDILEQMLIIENKLESKLVNGAANKTLSPQIALFVLRVKHKWTDKIVVEKSKRYTKAEQDENGEVLLRSMGLWEEWQDEQRKPKAKQAGNHVGNGMGVIPGKYGGMR
jgi:hypothetical protein